MERRTLQSKIEPALSLLGIRAALAVTLGVALMISPNVFFRALVGSLGMFAVTDGIFSALVRERTSGLYARIEGGLSLMAGILIMLVSETERGLLLLFCLRCVIVAATELFLLYKQSGSRFSFSPRDPHAYLTYAAVCLGVLSLGFLLAAGFGHGALELHVGVALQLVLWGGLLSAEVVDTHRATAR